jgi:hypothetical protein
MANITIELNKIQKKKKKKKIKKKKKMISKTEWPQVHFKEPFLAQLPTRLQLGQGHAKNLLNNR